MEYLRDSLKPKHHRTFTERAITSDYEHYSLGKFESHAIHEQHNGKTCRKKFEKCD